MKTGEFVALVAMMFSVVAFSIDAILPAFPHITAALNVPGRVHLMISAFMVGLAVGTLLAGPISDAIGRKPTMYVGMVLFIGAGIVAWQSQNYEVILAARVVQGLGAAGPRVVSMAIVRDLYAGRQMARIVSLALVLFTIVPTIAPALGALLQSFFGWRSILLAFNVFMAITALWVFLRLPESLPTESRRAFKVANLLAAGREILSHRTVRLTILAQGAALALIFSLIVQVQPIYDQSFGRAESFPYWFGGIALVSAASTSLANAAMVVRFGMRRLVTLGMVGHILAASLAVVGFFWLPGNHFEVFIFWQFMVIWLSGLCIGNLNAMALEPMGHIAGFAASFTGFIATIIAAFAATVSGWIFDGSPVPLVIQCLAMAIVGLYFMYRINQLEREA